MEDVQELKARLARIESELGQVHDEVGEALPRRRRHRMWRLLPPEVSRHLRASNREMLLAARSMLDSLIVRMERGDAESTSRRIPVD